MTLPTDSRGAEAAGLQSEVGARIWPVHVAKESAIYQADSDERFRGRIRSPRITSAIKLSGVETSPIVNICAKSLLVSFIIKVQMRLLSPCILV
jgi:hypothetical protein